MTGDEVELSRPLALEQVPSDGLEQTIEASVDERAALCLRFGLISLDSFTGTLRVVPLAGGPFFRVTGVIDAELAQECVVSLEPVPQSLSSEISAEFGPQADLPEELELILGDDEPHEPIVDGRIDLGELAAQHLALALDPYPRAADAVRQMESVVEDGLDDGSDPGRSDENPFAALADLKGRLPDRK